MPRHGSLANVKTGRLLTARSASSIGSAYILGVRGSDAGVDVPGGNATHKLPDAVRKTAEESVGLDFFLHNDGVTRRDVLRAVVEKRRRNATGCMSLPVTIIFFVLYSCAMMLHEDILNNFFLESALRRTLGETLEPISTVTDVWTWLQGAFARQFFIQEDMYGEPLPPSEWSRVLVYNQIQGSVVLRQTRRHHGPWGEPLSDPNNYTAALEEANEGFTPNTHQGRRLTLMHPEISLLSTRSSSDPTYDFLLHPTMPAEEIQQRLSYLEDRHWLDEHTHELAVHALLFNPEFGPRLQVLNVRLLFSAGGGVFYKLRVEALSLTGWGVSTLSIVADSLLLAMLIGTSVALLRHSVRALARGKFLQELMKASGIIEWLIVVGGWVDVGGFFFSLWLLDGVRRRLQACRDAAHGSADAMYGTSAELHTAAEDAMVWQASWYRIGIAWYTLVVMFRFFFAFEAQPRLAIVAKTLKAATTDLFHFFLVFVPTFLAYVISGNLLFGRRMAEFSTLQASLSTCFKITIENEFEWERLSEEYFITSGMWIWSFLLIVVLTMLNMVLAIMLDIYNEVRQSVDSADSIFIFLAQTAQRLFHARHWVNDRQLASTLAEMRGDTQVTQTNLREMFPDMPSVQNKILFDACRNHTEFTLKQKLQPSGILQASAAIKNSVDDANETMRDIVFGRTARSRSKEPVEEEEAETPRPARPRMLRAPFPGQPPIPGKRPPPLLPPGERSAAVGESTNNCGPQWLQELRKALDEQENLAADLERQLQELQWVWLTSQRHGMAMWRQAAGPAEDSSPLVIPSGMHVL